MDVRMDSKSFLSLESSRVARFPVLVLMFSPLRMVFRVSHIIIR